MSILALWALLLIFGAIILRISNVRPLWVAVLTAAVAAAFWALVIAWIGGGL
jgi:hypothetical protein